jgi:guanyl-specific ribonuclease Sa
MKRNALLRATWNHGAMRCSPLLRLLACGLVPLLGLHLSGAQAQDVYKWVDSHGVTHYTSSPPPPGVAAAILHAPSVPEPAASEPANALQRQVDEARRAAALREQAQATQNQAREAAQRDSAARLSQCAEARQQLETVSHGGPVFRYNTDGQREYLDDSARDGVIAHWQQQVKTLCGSVNGQTTVQDNATRQQVKSAQRTATCRAAQDALRDLQAVNTRAVPADLEQAREQVQRLCSGAP